MAADRDDQRSPALLAKGRQGDPWSSCRPTVKVSTAERPKPERRFTGAIEIAEQKWPHAGSRVVAQKDWIQPIRTGRLKAGAPP